MPADVLPAANLLPLHRLIFMPWRWNRVMQGLLLASVVLMFPAYVVSVPVVAFWAEEVTLPPFMGSALMVYCTPAGWLYENVALVESLFELEFWLLEGISEYWEESSVTVDSALLD